jgi:hypothetical protein
MGCASASPSTSAGASPGSAQGMGPATMQWSGSFQATQQASGDALAARGRNNVTGRVMLRASSKNAINATLDLSDVPTSMSDVHWALVSGRCGSGAIPLLVVSEFPLLSVSNGRAHVQGEVPLTLPTSGVYHVDAYRSNGADQSDVLACANLKMEARTE